ncbi:hypothetical protein PR048_003345 [Dryococelus australis]|uniref:Uncharacterized protein n=1 Tax=Dryococelus australis TaxID=614101 RepID=A0ABQ9IP97_9NEOP|nr:hypothetical protein PR048_003345 [Dryococelus australis]
MHSEALERRQLYLRQQRDKLLALKKHEREKQLQAAEAKMRPKSAQVAQTALAGQPDPATSKNLHVRRALAERLKSEVVGHL